MTLSKNFNDESNLGETIMNRSLVLGVALSALLLTTSCDSTVWLDTTLPSLTGVYASGACQTSSQELDVSVVLVNQGSNTTLNILPTTKVAKVKSKTTELPTHTRLPTVPSISPVRD